MTELERARAFLKLSQENLHQSRGAQAAYEQERGHHQSAWAWTALWENCFLAGLSWVWEEQERCPIWKSGLASRNYQEIIDLWERIVLIAGVPTPEEINDD